MKRIVFIISVLWGFTMVVCAQSLKVRSDGNILAFTPDIAESSNDVLDKVIIKARNRNAGLHVSRSGSPYSGSNLYGIYGDVEVQSGKFNYGFYSSVHRDNLNSGRAYGIFGVAGNATSGYNYGLVGHLAGTRDGAAIYGGLNFPGYVPGRYAGYFEGNVMVTGTINGITVGNSDIRYKQNILDLKKKGTSTLDKLLSLNPVEYNLKQMYSDELSDTAKVRVALYEEKSQVFQKKHYGLIAQELQQIYPDLVYEADNGYLSINYTGLIPLLIQSIKELTEEVETLKGNKSFKASEYDATSYDTTIQEEQLSVLYQNTPNPFNQTTEIAYRIPQNTNAFIGIYNLNGQQLKKYQLVNAPNGTIIISASEFAEGIYIYSLVVDNQEVDSKRMVLSN